MKKLLLFLLVITGQVAFAQNYSIKGKVVEKQGGVLPGASVILLQMQDSSVVTYTATTNSGLFTLIDVKKGDYIFKVTFLGYAPYFKNITTPSETDTLQMGIIELQQVVNKLSTVTVT